MKYIVDMFKECELIADLRKKILVDPANTREYEAIQWTHYSHVTRLFEQYYAEKDKIVPTVNNIYVTFRSMEGKERAVKAYDIHSLKR